MTGPEYVRGVAGGAPPTQKASVHAPSPHDDDARREALGRRGPRAPRPGRRPTASRPLLTPRVLAGALFTIAIAAVSALAAWPIYRTSHFVLLAGAAAAVAGTIAVVTWRRAWSGWLTAAVVAAAFLVLGVPLALPSRLTGGPLELLRGLGELATGAIVAWKDLVTVDLPVGSYRNLLVPAFVVFLAGTCTVLLLSWRESRAAYAAVPVALGMMSFGLFFGRTTVSAPLVLGPVTVPAPFEIAIGVVGLLACVGWLTWRTADERVRALRRAADSSGVRISRRPSAADRRGALLAVGMVAVAVIAALAVVPAATADADRRVLRSAIGPELDVSREPSPLAEYRTLFSDARADDVLFTVSADGPLPERVRLATLDGYDGEVFRTGGSDTVDEARFVRVPSALDAGPGRPVDVRVEIAGLTGIWMPTVGRVETVDFDGARAAALSDSFYYAAAAQAGVQTADGGLRRGDAYELAAVEPEIAEPDEIEAPGGAPARISAPESVREWMEAHVRGTGGAALQGLADLLRGRGYLSHALTLGESEPVWMQSLADYSFQPSASGHSLARIDALFRRLLEREADPRAAASGNYVAAIGDDEQFAVAIALMAGELGFPSRVVVGAHLWSDDPGVATCDEGACRAQDISAWAEVLSDRGEWVPVDATPQYSESPSLELTEQRDPEIVTEVRPESVEEVVPPEPVQEDSARGRDPQDSAGPDLTWLWPLLRTGGVVAAVAVLALGPFAVIVAAKASRRRARRTRGDAASRFAAGWDEYVDAAVDAGRVAPEAATRAEFAAALDTPRAAALARAADRAVFAGEPVTAGDAASFWTSVDEERRTFTQGKPVWRRLAATVSLRSFVRQTTPTAGRRPRFSERGQRRPRAVRITP